MSTESDKRVKKSRDKAAAGMKYVNKMKERGRKMSRLAEAIMLQAIEDLWIMTEKEGCITFFTGKEFHICADMAVMAFHDKVEVFDLVRNVIRQNSEIKFKQLRTRNYESGIVGKNDSPSLFAS